MTLPFIILKYVVIAIEAIATGIPMLLLFGTNGDFSVQNLPYMFLNFVLLSFAVMIIFWVAILIRNIFVSSEKAIVAMKNAFQFAIVSWFYIIVIPIGIFFLYFIVDWILVLLGANESSGDDNIANILFNSSRIGNLNPDAWSSIINNNF